MLVVRAVGVVGSAGSQRYSSLGVSNTNAVVVTTLSRVQSEVKTRILMRLIEHSPYRVMAAYDLATTDSGFGDRLARDVLSETGKNIGVIPLSNEENIKVFGKKISNFNGKYQSNPARLGCLRWFAANNDGFEHMWMLEDDTYLKNMSDFVRDYDLDTLAADFVGTGSAMLPFWVANGWRVGDKRHALNETTRVPYPTAFWCICRISRFLASIILDQLHVDRVSSHHEIYLPYVLHMHRLKWTPFFENARQHLALNAHGANGRQNFLALSQAEANSAVIVAHPIKQLNEADVKDKILRLHTSSKSTSSQLPRRFRCHNNTNVVGSCVAPRFCPSNQRLSTLGMCQYACTVQRRCVAIVYNRYRKCYLKQSITPQRADNPVYETISCVRIH